MPALEDEDKVTAAKVPEKIKELKQPGWTPQTLGEIGLSQRLGVAEEIIAGQDADMSKLKASNTEHLRNLASLTGQVEVLKRVCEGYEKEMSALKTVAQRAMADAERESAMMRGLLAFIQKHPLAKDIDFSPLLST